MCFISTCLIAITSITISIINSIHCFRKKNQHFVQPYIIAIYMQFHGTKHEAILDDERRRNQMVAKASIYFF
jgi:hypothetical protein